jgi:membrane protein implicated in regulation of membrane protease activity
MIEILLTQTLWWHWIVFGLVLIVAEIVMPLFVIIWFGLSAIIVGVVDLAFETSFMNELTLWMILSLILLYVWFRFLKDKSSTPSGQSDYKLDTKGVVIEAIPHGERGKVRFEAPVLGSSEWHATSDVTLEKGTVVRIEDINGQLIKVKKD